MSIKTIAVAAAVFAGAIAFEGKANAQLYYSSGYYTPEVVTASYYAPATPFAYYGTPYVGEYYPYYAGSYYGYPYYDSLYPGVVRRGLFGRRWYY